MSHDFSVLRTLRWRIIFSVFLIVLFSTIGFFLTDLLLFGSVATSVINLDRMARDFRPDVVDTNFIARDMFLSLHQGQGGPPDSMRAGLSDIATSDAQQNLKNYQSSPAGLSEFYHDPRWVLYEPIGW